MNIVVNQMEYEIMTLNGAYNNGHEGTKHQLKECAFYSDIMSQSELTTFSLLQHTIVNLHYSQDKFNCTVGIGIMTNLNRGNI